MSRRYGWVVLFVAAAAMVGSLPGRTQGLGLVTEPLLADLGIDRVSYAALNFWATIVGSAGALGIGYAIDRHGSRVVVTSVLASLGVVVCLMSRAESYVALAAGITLTRALGQSALSVVSLAIVGHWFVKRIDKAMAVYSVIISVGFMAAFPLVGYSVQAWGWRAAWLGIGVALAGVLAPLAALIVRRNPEAIGLLPDGERRCLVTTVSADVKGGGTEDANGRPTAVLAGYTWRSALAMPSFWVFAIGTALYGLVASGIGLFNESILGERGFGPNVYYQTLAVTAMTALIGNFLGGWLSSRVPLGRLMAAALFVLAGGVLALPFVASLTQVMAWATAMGLGGGLVMVLFFSVWGRVFGRLHLGRIQGVAQALTVVASAVGPLLLAWSVEWTGSYAGMFQLLAGMIAVVAVAALLMSMPDAPPVLNRVPHAGDATG
ncbi:MAG: MFS transporter [Gemmatimonadota bacterium]